MTEHDTQGRPIPGSAPPTPDGGLSGMTTGELQRTAIMSYMGEALDISGQPVEGRVTVRLSAIHANESVVDELLHRLEASEQRADAAERERDEAVTKIEGLRKAQVVMADLNDSPKPRHWDE